MVDYITGNLTIVFRVDGDPRPQPRQRHRAFKMGGRIITQNYTPKKDPVNTWKDLIALSAREHLPERPFTGPLRVTAEYFFRRPKSHYRTGKYSDLLKDDAPYYHTKKPDRDNLDKSFMDIMTNIGFWHDDCQIVGGSVCKYYTAPGERPGARFEIEVLGEERLCQCS